MSLIRIPFNWDARPHQRPLFNNFGHGKKFQRGCAVWHRRAGKDSTALNLTARDMFKRVGTYWHLFPEQTQARRAIWNGIDRQGRRIIDQFLPPEIRERKADQEMLIQTVNGSVWQMAGSDNYDSLVGSNPVGVVFSEWSLANPEAWEYIRPILVENGGWALFIYTPRGRNHGYQTYSNALKSDEWFCDRLTVADTHIVTEKQIQGERDAGMSEDKVQQEFYCSFEAANESQLISGGLVVDAQKADPHCSLSDAVVFGVDVARFGDDRSCIVIRQGRDCVSRPPIVVKEKLDTMQLAARVMAEAQVHKPDQIFIDGGGVGGGVVDRMRQMGQDVVEINFGWASDRSTPGVPRAVNKRTEMWLHMREWMRSGGSIPDWPELEMDLTGPLYSYDTHNAVALEKKADMKKRGVKSPDIADALALTFAYPVLPKSENNEDLQREVDEYDPVWN